MIHWSNLSLKKDTQTICWFIIQTKATIKKDTQPTKLSCWFIDIQPFKRSWFSTKKGYPTNQTNLYITIQTTQPSFWFYWNEDPTTTTILLRYVSLNFKNKRPTNQTISLNQIWIQPTQPSYWVVWSQILSKGDPTNQTILFSNSIEDIFENVTQPTKLSYWVMFLWICAHWVVSSLNFKKWRPNQPNHPNCLVKSNKDATSNTSCWVFFVEFQAKETQPTKLTYLIMVLKIFVKGDPTNQNIKISH